MVSIPKARPCFLGLKASASFKARMGGGKKEVALEGRVVLQIGSGRVSFR